MNNYYVKCYSSEEALDVVERLRRWKRHEIDPHIIIRIEEILDE